MKTTIVKDTKTPLLFGTNMDYHMYSILPQDTTMIYDRSYSEGFSQYTIPVIIKGDFQYESSDQNIISPIWLYNVDEDDVKSLIHYHPIDKQDLIMIIKESSISHSELIDILRHWDDK